MSCCIPIVFKPIEFENDLYVDGGLYNNTPIIYFKNYKNLIIITTDNFKYNNDNFNNYLYSLVMSKICFNDYFINNNINIIYCKYIDDISSIEYKLSLEKKKILFDTGYNLACEYVKLKHYYLYFNKKYKYNNYIY